MTETEPSEEARRPGPRPKRRRSRGQEQPRSGAATRRKILDAAVRVFAEKGVQDTRISDIAQDAEIAYGLVYHHFRNKDEILDEIFRARWDVFIRAVRRIARSDQSTNRKLLALARVILSAHRRDPDWVRVLMFEVQRTQRMLTPRRVERVGELFRLTAEMLREGRARGELRADLDPAFASYVFLGGLDSVLTVRALEAMGFAARSDESQGTDHSRLARSVVALFMNGMASADEA